MLTELAAGEGCLLMVGAAIASMVTVGTSPPQIATSSQKVLHKFITIRRNTCAARTLERFCDELPQKRVGIKSRPDKLRSELFLERHITAQSFGQFYKSAEDRLNALTKELPRLQAEVDYLKMNQLSAEAVTKKASSLAKTPLR